MREVVIVEAVRSPLGKRNGALAAMHSIDLLGAVQVLNDVNGTASLSPEQCDAIAGSAHTTVPPEIGRAHV